MRFKTLQWKLTVVILVIQFVSMSSVGVLYLIAYYLNFEPVVRLAKSPLMVPLVFFTVAMVLSALIAIPVTRFFLRPLKQLSEATLKVQKGDFNAEVEAPPGRGDFSDLFSNFNQMTKELRGTELFRSDFINNFSHEFKTPIVSIRGFARLLQEGNLTAEQHDKYVNIIAAESDRLANMATNILLLSKLENQKIVTDRTRFYLDEQLRHAILTLEKQWSSRNIELDIDLDPDGGTVFCTLRQEKNEAVVRIRDTGCGMSDAVITRIFEKFYQGDTSHSSAGNGIGLTIVGRILVLCGGRIQVESSPGQGSTFTVRLPMTA